VSTRRPRQFLPEEVELLTAMGNAVGIAIENARIYQEEQLIAGQLQVSERNYRDLFENASDAIWVHDLEGKILTANKATARLSGYNLDELAGMNIREFLPEESTTLAKEVRERLLQGELINESYEQKLIKKRGEEAYVKLSTRLIASDGVPRGFQHIARDVTLEKRMQENLRFYVHQITRAQEEERKRIARELHDDATQSLVNLIRQVDNFSENAPELGIKEVAFLKSLHQQAKVVLQGIRRFSQDLRPSILDDLGLEPALEWLTDDMEKQWGVETNVKVLGIPQRLEPEAEVTLFRIVQESLSNIRKHAQASRAQVTVEFGEDKIGVTITDNGKGFKLPETLDDLSRSGKLGLIGMQERVKLFNGELRVQSELGKGTTIIAEAPMRLLTIPTPP
jgi:PAS domain S-box-containing protein